MLLGLGTNMNLTPEFHQKARCVLCSYPVNLTVRILERFIIMDEHKTTSPMADKRNTAIFWFPFIYPILIKNI